MSDEKPKKDPEIEALARILKLLSKMDNPTRARVMTYLARRYPAEIPQ